MRFPIFGTLWLLCCLAAPLGYGQAVISEFMADNKKTLQDEDGASSDWIEIYNTSATTLNLSGWSLTVDSSHKARWQFPATNLVSHSYLVLFASGKDRAIAGQELHTDFNLKASGSYLALLKPDHSVASEFAPYPPQYPDTSYGISQQVTTNGILAAGAAARVLIPVNGTLGSSWQGTNFNDSAWTAGTTGAGYEALIPGFAVYNYVGSVGICSMDAADSVIANPSQQASVAVENTAVINYFNSGSPGNYGGDSQFPGFVAGVDRDNFTIRATAVITIPSAGAWTFGVNSDDGFRLRIGDFTMSYPDPRGPGDTLQTFNFPAAGDYPLELVFYECGGGSEVEMFAANGTFGFWDPTNFRLVGDTLHGGLTVKSAIAGSSANNSSSYRPWIGTDVQKPMYGSNTTAYIRVPFTVIDPSVYQSLTLRMRFDDGYVAYINGSEVARRNAGSSLSWNSAATASHSGALALAPEDIGISDHLANLHAGTNLLAIQGLNAVANDSSFLVVPELAEFVIVGGSTNYFAKASPGMPNSPGSVAFVSDTKFSSNRGFYTNAFDLTISTATPGATIRYTTNGTVPTLSNGLTYTAPLHIAATSIIRAAAFEDGYTPSNVDTQTYVFVADVIHQSANRAAPPGWPSSWGGNTVDYGMNQNVVTNPAYSGTIINDLQTIPSFSMVTDLANLFDPGTGIYANAYADGRLWERPASIELIYPDGTKGFQVDTGIRIRGGYSRSGGNPKHAFRFFFRNEYGTSPFKYPMFASQNGVTQFDGFDLRTFENYSWSFEGDPRGIFIRDVFSRDSQIDMGQPGERGDYYHLYINGQYWGLYNTAERFEAAYGASYFGGDKSQYDTIKVNPAAGYTIFATDGTMDAWTRLWQAANDGFSTAAAYQKIQGNNADGTRNPNYEVLLDVDNLIDYMLVILYGGNLDAPISSFLGNQGPNNWFGVRNTNGLTGFRFAAHDSEHTLLNNTENRVGPFVAGNPRTGGGLAKSNPQYIFQQLWTNPEFKVRLADRVQMHFFHNGALTPASAIARFLKRKDQIDRAVVGESARWGDSKRKPALTRNVEWVAEIRRITNSYMPQRTATVLGQLRARTLFPTVAAPDFTPFGGIVSNGFNLPITAAAGTIYYTLDGSDPRLPGGAISPSANSYIAPLILQKGVILKTRALSSTNWSAMNVAPFYVIQDFSGLLITELMYQPPNSSVLPGSAYEFLELKNAGSTTLDLSGVRFTNGIHFTFPMGTALAPGQFAVLASDATAFAAKYPGVPLAGAYTNNLSNGSETLTLVAPDGTRILSFAYGSKEPWPATPNGSGFSLVPINPNFNPDPGNPANWRASSQIGGSPGTDDPAPLVPVVFVNEVLSHPDTQQNDSVELHNPNATNVDIGGWYLTDDRAVPSKFHIPAHTAVPANGYIVFTEKDWNPSPTATNAFHLSSSGDQIYLFSGSTNGGLTGFSDGFSFGASAKGVTFGRYVNSVGDVQYPAQSANTLGIANSSPLVGPVVINEIQYHPAVGDVEFVELKNIASVPIPLFDPAIPTNRWRLNGVGFDFPDQTTIPAGGLLVVAGGDPAAFRTKYNIPAFIQVLGPYSGALQGGGETLSLQRPGAAEVDAVTGAVHIPYIDVDVVRYDNKAPWPLAAAGGGESLERRDSTKYGNDPINWQSSKGGPSPGRENYRNHPPTVSAGLDQTLVGSRFPYTSTLDGSTSDDGFPNPPGAISVQWSQLTGPGPVVFAQPNQQTTDVAFPAAGDYELQLTGNDSELQSSSTVTISISRATEPVTLSSKGAVWKYLDNGSNQGTNWTAINFDDSAWAAGPAPLGYGDAAGQLPATVNQFGPDPNNKYITTYYRRAFSVADPLSLTQLALHLQRDDAVAIYLNGLPVYRDNFTDGPIDYLTLALSPIDGSDEALIQLGPIDPASLIPGRNVLAAEVHQASPTSDDLFFEAELSGAGYPANQAPTASAGTGQTVTLPAGAALAGTVTDDGLPISPGIVSVVWSKTSGPGTVTFGDAHQLNTTAGFSAPGSYVLRLTASDGALSTFGEVTIMAKSDGSLPIVLTSVAWINTPSPAVQFSFNATPGMGYTVQYRDSLSSGTWMKLKDATGTDGNPSIEVTDPVAAGSTGRWYRVVSPQQP